MSDHGKSSLLVFFCAVAAAVSAILSSSTIQPAFHPGRGLLYFTDFTGRTITGTRP